MRFRVIKPLGDGTKRGDVIDADKFHNTAALVAQRFLEPIGDTERLDALEARIAALEGDATGKGRQKH